MNWIDEFLKLYFSGQRQEAYRVKKNNIPRRLYKFQPIEDSRINSLLNNEIWFSIPHALNDPYDCYGVYWEEDELSNYLSGILPSDTLSNKSINDIVNGALNSLRDHTRISCFSEELYNMPMWAHYASNHKGMCVEYDFSQLDADETFSKQLFPVGYEENRYNITNLIKLSFQKEPDMRVYLLYFLMQLKHKSWGYEKEWRILLTTRNKESGLVKSPVQPKAVYFGLDCKNFESISTTIKEVFNCPIYKLMQSNSKLYKLELLKI